MTFVPPGKDSPIGKSADFKLGGNAAGSAMEILRGFGTRLQARGMAQGNARAIVEAEKIKAAKEMTIKQMEIQAQAEAQQLEHEKAIKLARINNSHEIRKAKAEGEIDRLNQTQDTIHTHGILDRLVTDFPDADLTFETKPEGQRIEIRRPKEASSESSEGGSYL